MYFRSFKTWESLGNALHTHRTVMGMDGRDHFQLRKVLKDGYSRAYILERVAPAADVATSAVKA